MRIGFLLLGAVLAIGMVASPSAQAGFANLGFEAGSLGWDLYDPGGGQAGNSIQTDYTYIDPSFTTAFSGDDGYYYYAPEGIAYLEIHPGGSTASAPSDWEVAAQTATLSSSELYLTGMAGFDSRDYRRSGAGPGNESLTGIYGNDKARVALFAGSWTAEQISKNLAGAPVVIPWERSVWDDGTSTALDYMAVGGDGSTSVGPFADDPWTQWMATLPSAGDYTLAYLIQSGADPSGNEGADTQSHAVFDTSKIPEAQPVAFLGLGLGLFVLMGYSRRRRPC